MQQLEPLRRYLYIQAGYACQVAAGSVQAGNKPLCDGVGRDREDDRYRGRRGLYRE